MKRARPSWQARRHTSPPVEWASAKCGGGQSGSATCSMKASRSRSYSAKESTWPFMGLRSRRSDPPWPRQSKAATREAALAQLPDHLEIFLDRLGAPLEQADGSALAPAGRPPIGIAQADAVAGQDRADEGAFRNRIGIETEELHGNRSRPAANAAQGPPKIKPAASLAGRRRQQKPAPEGGGTMPALLTSGWRLAGEEPSANRTNGDGYRGLRLNGFRSVHSSAVQQRGGFAAAGNSPRDRAGTGAGRAATPMGATLESRRFGPHLNGRGRHDGSARNHPAIRAGGRTRFRNPSRSMRT